MRWRWLREGKKGGEGRLGLVACELVMVMVMVTVPSRAQIDRASSAANRLCYAMHKYDTRNNHR